MVKIYGSPFLISLGIFFDCSDNLCFRLHCLYSCPSTKFTLYSINWKLTGKHQTFWSELSGLVVRDFNSIKHFGGGSIIKFVIWFSFSKKPFLITFWRVILPPSHFMWSHFLFGTSQKEWTYNIYYFEHYFSLFSLLHPLPLYFILSFY